jgi:hypothetical protein
MFLVLNGVEPLAWLTDVLKLSGSRPPAMPEYRNSQTVLAGHPPSC